MKKIAVFLADGFEEVEALTPVDILRRGGYEVVTVSVKDKAGEEALLVESSHAIGVMADLCIEDLDFDSLDMILLPGGMPGTKNLEKCKTLIEQIRAFDEQKKYIAAICAAPSILGNMGILAGKKAVSYPSFEEFLSGAEVPQTEVAVDGHIITGRGMGCAIPFALTIVETISNKAKAEELARQVIYEVYR